MAAKGKIKTPTKKELTERLAKLEAANNVSELGTPEKQAAPKSVWNVDMIKVLLELRLRTYASLFQGSKSNQQLSILWETIAMRLSVVSGVVVSHPSAKEKYHSLKQDKRLETMLTLPLRTHTTGSTVEYFGDKSGLVHNEFGSSAERAIDDDSDKASEECDDVEAMVDTKRPVKRQKTSTSSVASGWCHWAKPLQMISLTLHL
ncbi:hypothetical protein H257_07845 [Aphanomyces astaci]|uniref:Myb/SANT-like domain-containing protein n=1 Tax=Aphanomyces astaci TaxID=112090 RepID=W4GJD9_APHAT|nr:hypothetical protein H257_07845 [Aphanomyces astaci]ETV79109.1 hypothetical protein H257_07845 [Aphanomyces astaci]|eukprot:XP_009831828.1 hypothetical protein H257_07845 [Aphanomyces astaci]